MNEREFQKNDEIEIDLGRIFRAVINKSWLVAAAAVICAVLTFLGTFFFVTPHLLFQKRRKTDDFGRKAAIFAEKLHKTA